MSRSGFVVLVVHTVGKSHQAVAEMHIFHDHVRVLDTQVEVAEIPEAADPERNELIRKGLCRILRDAKHGNGRVMRPAEAVKGFHRHDGKPRSRRALDQRIAVEDANQPAAALLEINVCGDRFAKIARTDQDDPGFLMDTEDIADDLAQFLDMIAIALLTETAEAIEILPDLRGGQPHSLRQFTGGDTLDLLALQIPEKSVIPGQTADHGVRDIFLLQSTRSYQRTLPRFFL